MAILGIIVHNLTLHKGCKTSDCNTIKSIFHCIPSSNDRSLSPCLLSQVNLCGPEKSSIQNDNILLCTIAKSCAVQKLSELFIMRTTLSHGMFKLYDMLYGSPKKLSLEFFHTFLHFG